ncbi:hypothetical protein J4211_05490 [Candidatus Woesearchaeota archaeon]|nr:hypothetical protein [Candidatus Woesearchaeota archaeon]
MSFINKNANLILLFLIIISAVTLVGATVFFQFKFEEINTEYNQKLQQLHTVSAELDKKQAALDKIQSDLNVKNEREQALGAQYSEVKQNKDQLEVNLEENKRKKAQDDLSACQTAKAQCTCPA